MTQHDPTELGLRQRGEWSLRSAREWRNPFADVVVRVELTAPDGGQRSVLAFHDGDHTWRWRFSPDQVGDWAWTTSAVPADPDLTASGRLTVTPRETRGHVQITPDRGWGFSFEDGTAVLPFGDTVYNLFGYAHCGVDVEPFLRRRVEQGFTHLRVRLTVSPFHPEDATAQGWYTRSCLPWQGQEQSPRLDRFNLDWFATVDRVIDLCDDLGLGLELIMESWGFDYPFNSRQHFTPELEQLLLDHLVARYDAHASTWFWTPMNEYEQYPHGVMAWTPEADRWMLRLARHIEATSAHGHPVVAHNGPVSPPFAQRFAADPEAIRAIMFQTWGDFSREGSWSASGIEHVMSEAFDGWTGSRILAEWGYERNPDFELLVPWHEHMDADHTRRGGWRGAFQAAGLVHGFENSWGPWCVLDHDQPGMADLLILRRFLTEEVDWTRLRPATDVLDVGDPSAPDHDGRRPRVLADPERDQVAVWFPVPGEGTVDASLVCHALRWFNPRTGESSAPDTLSSTTLCTPPSGERDDWCAVLQRPRAQGEGTTT